MASGKVTQKGHEIALHRLWTASPTITAPTKFKTGSGTTAAATTDTDLEIPFPITGQETVDDCETADWTDSADMTTSLNSTTFYVGSNSLNLTKDGGASVNASTSKTTTSVDFTSKKLELFLTVTDQTTLDLFATTDAVTIRFGSDASNYYEWTKDKADLSVGKNYINNLTSANAESTTGSPALASMDYSFIQLTTAAAASTWAAGKVLMDDWRVASDDDFSKTFVSGYPTLDNTNLQALVRSLLLSTEAVGATLTEHGLVNTDATPLLFSRSTFTGIDKDTSTQVIYVQRTRMA